MADNRKIRELALQVLFLWDAHCLKDDDAAKQVTHDGCDDPITRQRAFDLASAAWEHRELADQRVEKLAPHWPPRRQPSVDRNLFRMAVYELTHTPTPPKVVIDEAIELAKSFSTEQSPSFINAILDAVHKEQITNNK